MTESPPRSIRALMLVALQTKDTNTLPMLTLTAQRLLQASPVLMPGETEPRALHKDTLVGPDVQFTNIGVPSLEKFARVMYKLAVAADTSVESPPTNLSHTLFGRSFVTEARCRDLHAHAVAEARRLDRGPMVIMPPLLVRSEVDAVYRTGHCDLFLVCHHTGPVIPLVHQRQVVACGEHLWNLYLAHSMEYLNATNAARLLGAITC